MGLNATLVTLTPNTIAHAADVNTSLTNLNATTAMLNSSNDPHQIIGHNLLGSVDTGMYNFTNPISIGGIAGVSIKLNNYWNGSNDIFMGTGTLAYQLYLNAAGIHARKSNTTGTAGGVIVWVVASDLYT